MNEKLKIGILLDDNNVPAWQFKVLEEIRNSEFARIELLIRNIPGTSSTKSQKKTLGLKVVGLHEKIDKLIFNDGSNYYQPKNTSGLLKGIPEIFLSLVDGDTFQPLSQTDITGIRKYKLDVIVNLASFNPKGDILKLPRYGVWAYQIDGLANDSLIRGYTEVVNKSPVSAAVLEISREDSGRKTIIYCSWESTYRYSILRNRNRLFWRSSLLVPRVMKGIYKHGDDYLNKLIARYNGEEQEVAKRDSSSPSFWRASVNFLNFIYTTIKQIFKKIFYTDAFNWILLFELNNSGNVLQNSFRSFRKLKPSKDRFWADPFIISRDNRYYIFVEELFYQTGKGHISVLELDISGNFIGSRRIIDRPYHLSYPFVFEVDGNYYMIPESSQNRTIELYRCKNFPYDWEFVRNLMENINAVDTTLFFHSGKWWLFTTVDETNNVLGCGTELFLFYSDDLFSGKWISYPANPIISDIRKARPAGRIFKQGDNIYRPSQDCSVRYGRGFNMNQITKLTETEYEENLLFHVEPHWDNKLKGTHTFNFDKNFTVIDAYSFRRRI